MKNNKERKKANLAIASILFENGMDFNVIEKITDVTPIELLANKIEPTYDRKENVKDKKKK